MSLLTDLLLHLAGSALGPSTDRGIVATFSLASIGLAVATVWLLVTFPDPIRQPAWGGAVLVGSMLCGAGGALVSLLHLRRKASDRVFAPLGLIGNVVAIAVPMFWMIGR
jgi:hypothetical protein